MIGSKRADQRVTIRFSNDKKFLTKEVTSRRVCFVASALRTAPSHRVRKGVSTRVKTALPAERFVTRSIRDTLAKGQMPITAIVCDDHPAFARGLAALFEMEIGDIEVVDVATSGEEAERLVRDKLPDVVLMDIRMPRMDGIEATRRIKAASPTTHVVMLTVSEEAEDLYRALKAGATGYVVKDREVSEIADAIRSVHRGHFVIPTDLAGRFVHDLDGTDSNALNDVERAILAAIGHGETNREIGARLHLSERTVKRRVQDIYQKLHLADRLEAAIYAAQRGIGRPSNGGGP